MQYVIGIDAGTHSIRGLLFSVESKQVMASSNCTYQRKLDLGIQELSLDLVWNSFIQVCNELSANLNEKDRISGIGITHQRGTVVPVDKNARPLHFAFCDSDDRYLAPEKLAEFGLNTRDYYRLSGCPFVSFNGLAKILWCHENMPLLFEKAKAWMSLQDYLISNLVGHNVQSEGSTLRNGIYDVNRRGVAMDLFGLSAIKTDFLNVPIAKLGQPAGVVRGTDGLPGCMVGAKVIAVPGDQPAAVIGAGAVNETEIAVNLGTTFVASMFSRKTISDHTEMITQEILPDDYYAIEFGTGAGGQFTDWAAKLLFGKVPDTKKEWMDIDDMAGEIQPGSDGLSVVPLLWQVTSPGITGRIFNINAAHDRRHFVRAIYEGLAYELKLSILKLEDAMGKRAKSLKVFGGFGKNENFLNILSYVMDRTVISPCQDQTSAYGALMTAFYGIGGFSDVFEASCFADHSQHVFEPQIEGEVAFYEREFDDYKKRR